MTGAGTAMAGKGQNIIQTIREYGSQLFGFIRSRVNTREDAEDILQEVWFQLSRLPDAETVESISGWLYRVARNRITDNYRKRKNGLTDDGLVTGEDGEWQVTDLVRDDRADPETIHLRAMFREAFFTALGELPENQRRVFEMNELEDMTMQEIANREGEKLKTIISRKRYAVLHLRKRLQNLYNELINY
jgi:RNA polymerase sigma factor (sigma-70 family)